MATVTWPSTIINSKPKSGTGKLSLCCFMLLVLANSDWACSAQEFLSTSSQTKGRKCPNNLDQNTAKHLLLSSPLRSLLVPSHCTIPLLQAVVYYCHQISPAMPCHFGRISSNYQTNNKCIQITSQLSQPPSSAFSRLDHTGCWPHWEL